MATKQMKTGRISKIEHRQIQRYLDNNSSVELIAKKLNRNPDSVDTYVKKHFGVGITREEQLAYNLEKRPYYYELKAQFDGDELELFKYHWSRIIEQFNNDVFPTEEFQIVDVIKIEMLMNRCLKSNKDIIDQINTLRVQLDRIDPTNEDNVDRLMQLEAQIGSLRASQESANKDFRDLQEKKGRMLKDLKGTREQRIKRLEDSRESFSAWVANLMGNPELLKQYGLEMEKMRLATDVEKQRLAQYHKYEDGVIDQPLLNADTVNKE